MVGRIRNGVVLQFKFIARPEIHLGNENVVTRSLGCYSARTDWIA